MESIQAVKQAAADLIWPVADKQSYAVKPWNIKRAVYAAGFSPNQKLPANCTVARALVPYTFEPLPEKQALYEYLMDTNRQAPSGRKANLSCSSYWSSIYRAEELETFGKLADLCWKPTNRAEWVEWRDQMYALWHSKDRGYGMSYKTISFAALLLWPLECELVPVDTHVLQRLGCPEKGTPQQRTRYMEIEQMVIDERHEAGCDDTPLGIWHWLKWNEHLTGEASVVESHKDLCCFDSEIA
jgi:hypothetical protein